MAVQAPRNMSHALADVVMVVVIGICVALAFYYNPDD
jgi:hypothetical protein